MLSNSPQILDCTLRDGGYVIDFKFTVEEIKNVVLELSESGIIYIEVGHGLGLGAYRRHGGEGVLCDQDTLKAALEVKNSSMIGMFFIVGIGDLDDIRMASEMGRKCRTDPVSDSPSD